MYYYFCYFLHHYYHHYYTQLLLWQLLPTYYHWWLLLPPPFDFESGVRVMCDVDYLCANFSLPRPLCSRVTPDVRDTQTDRRQTKASLNASALWGPFVIIKDVQMFRLTHRTWAWSYQSGVVEWWWIDFVCRRVMILLEVTVIALGGEVQGRIGSPQPLKPGTADGSGPSSNQMQTSDPPPNNGSPYLFYCKGHFIIIIIMWQHYQGEQSQRLQIMPS